MNPAEQLRKIREVLDECARPLFFFDDDADGVCSFLQLYRYAKKGVGVIVKAAPVLSESYVRKIEEHEPDVVFVLDKPGLSHEFIEQCKVPIVWIDHHPPQQPPPKVRYFNPKLSDPADFRPTSYWCYQVAQQDLWIAMTGIVGDWQLTELAPEFAAAHPELLPPTISRPQDALFTTRIGQFARLISFVIKGRISEAMNCVKILAQLDSPEEALDQTTSRGRYLYRKFQHTKKEYDRLLRIAEHRVNPEKLLIFSYDEESTSFTGDLSNELIYRHPDKVILICRSKGGEMKCSIRSTDVNLQVAVERALTGVEGYGGGHEHACGACVKDHEWERFLENLRAEIASQATSSSANTSTSS